MKKCLNVPSASAVPFVVILLLLTVGCRTPIPTNAVWYGTATLYGGAELPFTFMLSSDGATERGTFFVGDEPTEIPEIRMTGDSLIFTLSEYGAAMRFAWDGVSLRGRYERYRSDTTSFPIVASTTSPPRTKTEGKNIALAGSFRVFKGVPPDRDTSASAVFWSRNDSTFGTIVAHYGDDGLYAGVQLGDTVRLGRFNGWQALLMVIARRGEDWVATRYARDLPPDTVTLVSRPEAAPAIPADRRARMRSPRNRFVFSGVSVEGDTITNMDPRFRGKALIVDIMGTWCHNCLDAAPLLNALQREYGPKGLDVVSLSLELTNDLAEGMKNLELFRKRHHVSYLLLYGGDLSEENVEARVRSQIDNFGGYPTTMFIDRSGKVVNVHTGFRGPGTGPGYQNEVATFFRMAERIIQ